MATRLYAPPTQNALQKTLDAQLDQVVTAAATLNNTTGVQNLPGVFVVDRIDSNGEETSSKREYISFTNISGSNVTTLVRGLGGSSDQDHSVGAIVEFIPDITWAQSIYDGLSQILTPSTGSLDTSKVVAMTGNQTVAGDKTFSGTTTHSGTMANTGHSSFTNTKFPKVAGEYDNGNSGTSKAIDWSNGDRQLVTITGDACAFTFSNATKGQTLTLRVVEDGTGHTAHTWPTLKWPGGTVGTPTITANAINVYIFYFDGTNYLTQLAGGFA